MPTQTTPKPTISGPATGRMLAPFALPTADGRRVRSTDERQRRNLVLVVDDGDQAGAARRLLSGLVACTGDLRAASSVVYAIGAEPIAHGSASIVSLLDPAGTVAAAERLTPPAVLIADRFGELWALWAGGALPGADEIVRWLDFIEIQCPECSPSEW